MLAISEMADGRDRNVAISESRLELISYRESAGMMPPRPIVFGTFAEYTAIEQEQLDVWIRRSRRAYASEPPGAEIGGEA